MLATLVIGLREGLEAALIVGIIAAFLRNNGKSLTAMWLGVGLAVALSIAVGAVLGMVEQALPQASQEGMESVIGAIAIFFVTGMIAWMNTHARGMKKELETEAAEALSQGSAYALAGMAFLAVLKEGFETSVFLLATFSAAQSAALAAGGAIVGLLLAVAIGWGIYVGGVRINLSRFFRFTGAFLILVAAGLVITALRTAHEAGWLNAGQQPTINLAWLVAPGTVQSALITGVLGIPADPRLIEVIGWLAYLVPVVLFVYWPPSRRPGMRLAARLQLAVAAALVVAAAGLAVAYPHPRPRSPAQATIVAAIGTDPAPVGKVHLSAGANDVPAALKVSLDGSAETTLALPKGGYHREQHDGVDALTWNLDRAPALADAPSSLTLDRVVALAGGRIPVGLNPGQHPGPFDATWSGRNSTQVWIADGLLLDAAKRTKAIVTLSGSGLETPRTLTVAAGSVASARGWQISAAYRDQVISALHAVAKAGTERQFWAIQLPIALVLVALLLAVVAGRNLIRLGRVPAVTDNSIPNLAAVPPILPQKVQPMLRISPTRYPIPFGAAAAVFALSLATCANAATQDTSSAPVKNGAAQIAITLTGDNGGSCILDHGEAKAGPVTFTVTNKTATALTEVELQNENRIIGEKENLAPGLPPVSFTTTLGGGTYQIYCPGAARELQDFKVTGKAAPKSTGSTAEILAAGTKGYATYVDGVVNAMVTAVTTLDTDINAGNLAKARIDYALARPFYERIESDVDGFVLPGFKATDNAGNLDYLIDMRASNLDPAVGWHGFHAIERDLFQAGQISDGTKKLADELLKNVNTLDARVKGLTYKPEDLANGAADLLEEVQSTKISGEEEAFGHYDLLTFAANVEGAEQAFAFLAPGLEKIDPDLAKQVSTQFANVKALLETYRDPAIPGGYKIYTAQLKASAAAKLSKTVQALQEPLSKIAEKVASAH